MSYPQDFKGAAEPLSPGAYASAAAQLKVSLPAIQAVAEVESGAYGAFDDHGRPTIRFEPHVFFRQTNNVRQAPSPGHTYGALIAAMAVDHDAALRSCSWGRFQVMGFHAEFLGYGSVSRMVALACESEDHHLDFFVRYIDRNGLATALRNHDWPAFAHGYNGPAYAQNRYDEKMAAAYARHKEQARPKAPNRLNTPKQAQAALKAMGYDPGPIDGIWGNLSRAAGKRFAEERGLSIAHVHQPRARFYDAVQVAVYERGLRG